MGRPVTQIPEGATVYTDALRGCTLPELLDAANLKRWPNNECVDEWALLRNWAIQTETLMLDVTENMKWEERAAELTGTLPYPEWVTARLGALSERTRARKLAQDRLRHKYGYKRPRRWGLIARDVRALHAAWSETKGRTRVT